MGGGTAPVPLRGPIQLLAADLLQRRQVVTHHMPQHIVRNVLVIMAQHVADPRDLRPRYFWMPGFQLVGQVTAGLGDDFNAALDEPALAPVRFVTPTISLRISSTASMMSVRRGT